MKSITKNSRKRNSLLTSWLVMSLTIVLSIVLMGAADRLENKYALKQDYSFGSLTTYGAVTQEVLDTLDTPVHAYALFSPGNEDLALISLLERYQAGSAFFTFSVENLAENPLLVHNISDSLLDSAVSTDCLIVHSKQMDRTRVLDANDYITADFDASTGQFVASGAQYEDSVTEAIVYVTSAQLPSIQLLKGHDELDLEEAAAMVDFLVDKNYEVRSVDLSRQDTLSNDDLLIVLSPRKDLTQQELSDIMAYVEKGGSLFFTTDYSDPHDLPNWTALLRYYGIGIVPGVVITETEDAASYYESPMYVMPHMQDSEATTPLIASGQDRLILVGARALTLTQELQTDLQVIPLLVSGQAYIHIIDEDNLSMERQPGSPSGTFTLAAHSNRATKDGTRSQAFVIGNSTLFTDQWLHANTYSTEFMLEVIQTLYPEHPEDLPIAPKPAFRRPMVYDAIILPALFTFIMPALIMLAAVLVLLPRKRL